MTIFLKIHMLAQVQCFQILKIESNAIFFLEQKLQIEINVEMVCGKKVQKESSVSLSIPFLFV